MTTVSIHTTGNPTVNASYDRTAIKSISTQADPWGSPVVAELALARYGVPSGTIQAPIVENVIGDNIEGLKDSYVASTFSSGTWPSNSGSRNSNLTRGTPFISSTKLNGVDILEGTTADGLRFPSDLMTSTYTLFHVARYNDGAKERIFHSYVGNWLSGFHSSKAGVAYHTGWVTASGTDHEGTNWVISTDQEDLYRSNGVTRGTGNGGVLTPGLSVNHGVYTAELSDWQVAEIIVYDRELNSTEYGQVEQYLSRKYNLPLNGDVADQYPFPGIFEAGPKSSSDISFIEPEYTKPSISVKEKLALLSTSTQTSNRHPGGGGGNGGSGGGSGPKQSWY